MPRPLILTDALEELPADRPLDVGPAKTATQALTPGQIVAGENVTVEWIDGVLTISAAGGGAATPGFGLNTIAPMVGRAVMPEGGDALADSGVRAANAATATAPGVDFALPTTAIAREAL